MQVLFESCQDKLINCYYNQAPSEELLGLAEQVRKFLYVYSPDHPALATIKKSEAYQKVAELIKLN